MTTIDPIVLDAVEVVPAGPLSGRLYAPPSKSVTNRLLVISALADGTSRLTGVLRSDDTAVMMAALAALGAGIDDLGDDDIEVTGTGGRLRGPDTVISAGLSGTTLRWLAAVALLAPEPVVLDGEPPLRNRPIQPLLQALRSLGATIETDEGRPPLRISSRGMRGGPVRVDAAGSSQFATSLLLVAPYAEHDLKLEIANLGAAGYVDLTVEEMTRWGAEVRGSGSGRYIVTAGRHYRARDETVEFDASAAAHLFALAMATGGSVTVANAVATRQPDSGIVAVFEQMGAEVSADAEGGVTVARPGELLGVDVDVALMPDQVPALAVLGALAFGTTTLRHVSVSRGHETDRVAAITSELRRLGSTLEESDDTLVIHGGHRLHGGVVDTYDDHRMAMALSSLAAVVDGVSIKDPSCVRKTYPGYWSDAASLGLRWVGDERGGVAGESDEADAPERW